MGSEVPEGGAPESIPRSRFARRDRQEENLGKRMVTLLCEPKTRNMSRGALIPLREYTWVLTMIQMLNGPESNVYTIGAFTLGHTLLHPSRGRPWIWVSAARRPGLRPRTVEPRHRLLSLLLVVTLVLAPGHPGTDML